MIENDMYEADLSSQQPRDQMRKGYQKKENISYQRTDQEGHESKERENE